MESEKVALAVLIRVNFLRIANEFAPAKNEALYAATST